MSALQAALFAIGAALVSATSACLWLRARRHSQWGTALVAAAIPLCVSAVLMVGIGKTTQADEGIWNAARLTPSVALAKGHEVYSTRTAGVVQTTMYPPLWVVSYLPVAVGATPSQVLRIGLILTLLFAFIPVFLLLIDAAPTIGVGVLASAAFVMASLWFDSLAYALFRPHADAPALGYAMAACWLTLRPGPVTGRRMALLALLAWFSVLSKQVMVPLLVALPLWFLFVHGPRQWLRLVGWLAVTGVGTAAMLMLFFRPEGVLFNSLTIPARVPWKGDAPRSLMALIALLALVVHSIPLVLLMTASASASAALRVRASSSSAGARDFLTDNSWTLLAGVALCMVPVSVVGRIKLGGAINTFSPTTYFLLAAGVLATVGVARRLRDHAGPRVHQAGIGALALCAGILAVGGTARTLLDSNPPLRRHPSQQAYDHLMRADAGAYFPLHPLAHLLADGSYVHFGSALYDRESLARLPLSGPHRRRHLPVDPSMVCWDREYWGQAWLNRNYFTEYTRPTEVGQLSPWWTCYMR